MGLFSRNKKEKVKMTPHEQAFNSANNVFKDMLLSDEVIEKVLKGKGNSTNRVFSTGILAATNKRLLYYYQDGNKTGKENILYNKILSVSKISGYENNMGSYIGISIELANGMQRVVRCLNKDIYNTMINDIMFYIEQNR